jgi:two-component system chemotaxis response regulator CheY
MAFNVLIVDDSSVMRKMIINSLRGCGLLFCDIHEAENGLRGLEVLKQQEVDFVLSDVHMPIMNGEEMVDQLRKDPSFEKLPVIFISSESTEERIVVLTKKGAGFIKKPFSPKQLGETIIGMIGGVHGRSNNSRT